MIVVDPNPKIGERLLGKRQLAMIIDALNKRGVDRPCPRCGHEVFLLEQGLATHSLQKSSSETTLGGLAIPVALTSCVRCGFLSEHALGALGLLNDPVFEAAGEDAE